MVGLNELAVAALHNNNDNNDADGLEQFATVCLLSARAQARGSRPSYGVIIMGQGSCNEFRSLQAPTICNDHDGIRTVLITIDWIQRDSGTVWPAN